MVNFILDFDLCQCRAGMRLSSVINPSLNQSMKASPFATWSLKALSVIASALLVGVAQAAPPSNDSFGSRRAVAQSLPQFVNGTTVDATWQTGEPDTGHPSVWYSWTAPFTGAVGIKIHHASTYHWVYCVHGDLGGTVSPARWLAIGHNDVGGPAKTCKFYALKGKHYRFCVVCPTGNETTFQLEIYRVSTINPSFPVQWCTPKSNDHFGTPYSCSNTFNRSFFQYSYECTFQSGESSFFGTWCNPSWFSGTYGGTWCKWTAPKTGTATWACRNVTSNPNIFCAAFSNASSIPSLVHKAHGSTSCSWQCVAGTTYRLYCLSPYEPNVYSQISVR